MQILRDFMSTPAIGIDVKATITEAAKIMARKKIGCLLVQDKKECVGIVTRSDLVNRVLAKGLDPNKTRVAKVYSKRLVTLDFMLGVDEAQEKMVQKNIKRLGVTKHGKVAGIFTLKDLVHH